MSAIGERIVRELLRDLRGRRGLRHAWGDIDEDIQAEIVSQWEAIVRDVLDAAVEEIPETYHLGDLRIDEER